MPPTKSWRPLPLPSSADMPVLLVSMNAEAAAYTVHITDMANMWTESLDRKAICIRGWGENTSIDPSDTPDNMSKFLTSLESALDLSHPNNYQTKLHLMKASQADAGDDGLTLQITCELPGLQPLKWPMHLKKAPASAIATDLVVPLVQAHSTRHKEVESLMDILAQKDAVLNRLLDKLDAMGTGLEHVFNPLSGKKKVSRAVAAEKVPGLAPFNRRHWKSDAANKESGPTNTEALVTEVFGGEGLIFETAPATNDSPQLDEWWREFTGASSSQRPSQRNASLPGEKAPPPDEDSMDVDDHFQVQLTPPHLARSRKPAATAIKPNPDDDSTEDELQPSKHDRIVPTETQGTKAKKPSTRLGTLGGKKQAVSPRSPGPVPSPQTKRTEHHNIDDSETASESDDDDVTASLPDDNQPPSSPPPSKNIGKKSGMGLGRISGSRLKDTTQQPPVVVDTPDETSQQPPQPVPKRLGLIGKKKASEKSPLDTAAVENRGRSRVTEIEEDAVPESKPRETSQERADRKREELKRELQKKATAGPAKKKRKF